MPYYASKVQKAIKKFFTKFMSLIVAGTLVTSAALAQDSATKSYQLEEIIVTAQKREQNLQDVPISITAVSSERLADAGILTTEDLGTVVPGLNVSRQLGTIAPILRGVGNYNVAAGNENAVAIYVDGVYQPSSYAGLFSLTNIDRVEVLRGPQGTLFGRNATGGLIHVVTSRPSTETSGNFSASYGSQDTAELKLYATTGLSDNVAADVSVFYREQGEGFGENINTGDDALFRDEMVARAKILFESDIHELVLAADYASIDSDFGLARRPLDGTPTVFGTLAPTDFFDVNRAGTAGSDNEQWGVSAHFTREFGGFDFVAVLAHKETDAFFTLDQGEAPIAFLPVAADVVGESNSAELRIQSSVEGQLEWVLGAYYFDSDDRFDPVDVSGIAIIGATALLPGGPFERNLNNSRQDTTALALFGETVWSINDRTRLTMGYRYSTDDKDFTQQTTLIAGPGSPLGQGTVVPTPVYTDSASFDEPSWRVTIDRSIGEGGHLLYATIAHGFKSGTFNTSTAGPDAGPINPELLDSYELGFKSVFAGNRVQINGSAFFYEYDDLQLSTQIAGTSVVRNVAEAETHGMELELAAALSSDLSINMSLAWTDTEFLSFPNAEVTTPNPTFAPCPGGAPPTPNCSATGDVSGSQLPRAPELMFSAGASYNRAVSLGDLGLGLNVSYNDGSYQDFANRVEIDSYTLINANASLRFGADGQYMLRLYGQNLGDEEYASYITATAFGDTVAAAPGRQFGLAFRYDW